jgi:hypothetical protein
MMTNLVLIATILLTTPWLPPQYEVRGDTGDLDYTLHILSNGFLQQANESFPTWEECRHEGNRLASLGKIRNYYCRHE